MIQRIDEMNLVCINTSVMFASIDRDTQLGHSITFGVVLNVLNTN